MGYHGETANYTQICEYEIIPDWYKDLVSQIPFLNLSFTGELAVVPWGALGTFRDLESLSDIPNLYPDLELPGNGYLPFACAEDGDRWMFAVDSLPTDPVFYFSASDYGGGSISAWPDCLHQFSHSFSLFLEAVTPIDGWL